MSPQSPQATPSRLCPRCGTRTEDIRCPHDGTATVAAMTAASDPRVGRTVAGRYQLEARIGHGGFGSVYRARHLETGGAVAIKLLASHLAAEEGIVRRFYLEAQNTHKLQHPNTVRVIDFGASDGTVDGTGDVPGLYLATEFVDGHTLLEVMRRDGPMAPRRALRIIRQLLKSLGEAHERGLVHRDIKPGNIMLADQFGEPDFVKVLDFGIARSIDESSQLTVGAVGTPLYMAPEQALQQAVDGRADLYAAGCILYELLTGRPTIAVDDPGAPPLAIMIAQIHEPTRRLRERVQGCPPELDTLVYTLLAKAPDERPATAAAVLAQIDAIERAHPNLDTPLASAAPDPAVAAADTITGDTLFPEGGDAPPSASGWAGKPPEVVQRQVEEMLGALDLFGTGQPTFDPPPGQPTPRESPTQEVVAELVPNRRPLIAFAVLTLIGAVALWYLAGPGAQDAPAVNPPPERAERAPAPEAPQPGAEVASVVRGPMVVEDELPRRVPAGASTVMAQMLPLSRELAAPTGQPRRSAEDKSALAIALTLHSQPAGAQVRVEETGEAVAQATPWVGTLPPLAAERLRDGQTIHLRFARKGHRSAIEAISPGASGAITVRSTLRTLRTRRAAPTKQPTGLPPVRLD